MDMRVEITVPESSKKHTGYSIEAYAVDAVGNKHDVNEAFWKESHICAMLRLIEGPPYLLRPIRVLPPSPPSFPNLVLPFTY